MIENQILTEKKVEAKVTVFVREEELIKGTKVILMTYKGVVHLDKIENYDPQTRQITLSSVSSQNNDPIILKKGKNGELTFETWYMYLHRKIVDKHMIIGVSKGFHITFDDKPYYEKINEEQIEKMLKYGAVKVTTDELQSFIAMNIIVNDTIIFSKMYPQSMPKSKYTFVLDFLESVKNLFFDKDGSAYNTLKRKIKKTHPNNLLAFDVWCVKIISYINWHQQE